MPSPSRSRTVRRGLALLSASCVLMLGVPTQTQAAVRAVPAAPGCASATRTGTTGLPAPAAPGRRAPVALPRDEAPHFKANEWWYFSGQLWGVDGAGTLHCYGFEYVTFQFLGGKAPVYVGNFAVTDLTRRAFRYGAQVDSYPVPRTPGRFVLHTGPWSMRGWGGSDELHADLPGYGLDLRLQTTKPPALHSRDGVMGFGPFGVTKYYSWTSLLTGGTILDHGARISVLGTSWMDHQWGDFNFASGGGWDWFSLRMADGVQWMLYFIRDRNGRIVQTVGTRIGLDGRTTNLAKNRLSVQATGFWHSPVTGITYSSGWRVKVPDGSFTVTPDLRRQELDLRQIQGVAYWEGAVTVRGKVAGKNVSGIGYTEINPANAP